MRLRLRSPRARLDKRGGRSRITLGIALGWIAGLVSVALVYGIVRADDIAHARAVCAAHHEVYIGVTAPHRRLRPTDVRCFAFRPGKQVSPVNTYSLHHSSLLDALDVLLLLILFAVCVMAGRYCERGIRRLFGPRDRMVRGGRP